MKAYLKNIRFKCLADCMNCCSLTGGYVYLTIDEATKIADFLETKENDFLKWFTRLIDDQLCLADGDEENCVFLEYHKCLIYPVRPSQCRTYPFWPENMKTMERWELTKRDCPGIGTGKMIDHQEIIKISKGKSLDSNR